jgi:hypothetical protein
MDNKIISTWLGLSVLIIFAITVGSFAWIFNRSCEQNMPDLSTATVSKNQKQQNQQASGTDLQTYTNNKYEFELKYPSNFSKFSIGNEDDDPDCITFIDNEFKKNRDISVNKIIEISVGAIKECSTASPHYSGEGSTLKYLGEEQVKLGNHKFLKKHYQDVPMCASSLCKAFSFYTWTTVDFKTNLTFMYNSFFTVDPEGHEAEFEKILSSFRSIK